MRIRISHESIYRYDAPVSGVIQTLRLTPRNHDGQYVVFWRIDISEDCRLDDHEDAFGNITHTFTAEGTFTELGVTVDGEVDTQDTHGIVRGAIERFPPSLFLRETALTRPDTAILAFAREARAANGEDTLALLHHMTERLHREVVFDPDPTHTATTAAEAFALRRGVCQDLSHVFISAARSLNIPARYVGGYFHRADGVVRQEAGHAWAEAFVPDVGWVGFDPANGISPTDAHVRVAIGLDFLGASPVRGARKGGGSEALSVTIHVAQAAGQMQN
ncbi:MAG TPA: transglutaminase family protein [Xanthobacteraceae bacterium]|nr:transglutaminase family protein [Xanthobacteraceae bacterium]